MEEPVPKGTESCQKRTIAGELKAGTVAGAIGKGVS